MRWGSDDIGVVLTRNEIWLLLHALAEANVPPVDWEGNRVEPWVIGELRSRLQSALRPEPLSDVEERPIIRLDSEVGRSLAQAGVRPLVLSDGYDLGSLLAACAERGWGVDVRLPVGAGPMTPAEARVTVGTGHSALGTGNEIGEGERTFVGLERPVVALARAVIGAASGGTGHWAPDTAQAPLTPDPPPLIGRGGTAEEYVVPMAGINPGERQDLIRDMAVQGWELVGEEERGVVFRRRHGDGAPG